MLQKFVAMHQNCPLRIHSLIANLIVPRLFPLFPLQSKDIKNYEPQKWSKIQN